MIYRFLESKWVIDMSKIKWLLPTPAWPDTASIVITPKLILPGTESRSIQNETHEIATIKIDGR